MLISYRLVNDNQWAFDPSTAQNDPYEQRLLQSEELSDDDDKLVSLETLKTQQQIE